MVGVQQQAGRLVNILRPSGMHGAVLIDSTMRNIEQEYESERRESILSGIPPRIRD